MKLQNWNILADVQMLPDKEFNEMYHDLIRYQKGE